MLDGFRFLEIHNSARKSAEHSAAEISETWGALLSFSFHGVVIPRTVSHTVCLQRDLSHALGALIQGCQLPSCCIFRICEPFLNSLFSLCLSRLRSLGLSQSFPLHREFHCGQHLFCSFIHSFLHSMLVDASYLAGIFLGVGERAIHLSLPLGNCGGGKMVSWMNTS